MGSRSHVICPAAWVARDGACWLPGVFNGRGFRLRVPGVLYLRFEVLNYHPYSAAGELVCFVFFATPTNRTGQVATTDSFFPHRHLYPRRLGEKRSKRSSLSRPLRWESNKRCVYVYDPHLFVGPYRLPHRQPPSNRGAPSPAAVAASAFRNGYRRFCRRHAPLQDREAGVDFCTHAACGNWQSCGSAGGGVSRWCGRLRFQI